MKYLPYCLTNILSKRAKKLHCKYHIKSMWYADNEINFITICTDGPGYWIGRGGIELKKLEAELNSTMSSFNNMTVHLRIQECETPR